MTSTLGRERPVTPKHVVVRDHVRGLADGARPGTAMPSERELVQEFGVARMTVRQALDALVNEGLLERSPGRGTFVASRAPRSRRVCGFTDEMVARGVRVGSRTVQARLELPGPNITRALGMAHPEPVVRWRRLRFADGRSACIEDTFFADDLLPGFLGTDLPPSLYAHLESHGLRPTWAQDTIRAATAVTEEADLLGCQAGAALVRVTRRAGAGDRTVLVSRTTYHPDEHTVSQLHDDH